MAFLCLVFTLGFKAGNGQNTQTQSDNIEENDSTLYEKLSASIKRKKSFYSFEYGLTTGSSLVPGSYFGFEYYKKASRPICAGFFFNYSSYQIEKPLLYTAQLSSIEDTYGNSTTQYERRRTRTINYQVDKVSLFELGLSARYNITKKLTLKAVGTLTVGQRLAGDYDDWYIDSTFRIEEGQEPELASINKGSNSGNFFDRYISDASIQNQFAFHLGAEQKISKRLRITARASIPMGTLFPETISYELFSRDADIEVHKESGSFPFRPLFLKAGVSWTF